MRFLETPNCVHVWCVCFDMAWDTSRLNVSCWMFNLFDDRCEMLLIVALDVCVEFINWSVLFSLSQVSVLNAFNDARSAKRDKPKLKGMSTLIHFHHHRRLWWINPSHRVHKFTNGYNFSQCLFTCKLDRAQKYVRYGLRASRIRLFSMIYKYNKKFHLFVRKANGYDV